MARSADLVDLSIAIVVDTVAAFFCDRRASRGRTGDARAFGIADVGARANTRANAHCAGLSFVRVGFVDFAIAVVVDVVAGFGFGCDHSAASAPLSGGTGFKARFASTNAVPYAPDLGAALCQGGIASAGEVVDATIAIIVFVVADFGAWRGRGAALPLAIGAGFRSCSALVGAGLGESFVDFAVAIVVFGIAGFWAGLGGVALHPLSGLAEFGSCAASGGTRLRKVVVDLAVAVVVLVVAKLGGGCDFANTSAPFSAITGLLAFFA